MPLGGPFHQSIEGSSDSRSCMLNIRGRGPNSKIISIEEDFMDEGRKAGRSLIKREKRTNPRTKPGGHLYEDRKDNYENYRFELLNVNLRDKIISI